MWAQEAQYRKSTIERGKILLLELSPCLVESSFSSQGAVALGIPFNLFSSPQTLPRTANPLLTWPLQIRSDPHVLWKDSCLSRLQSPVFWRNKTFCSSIATARLLSDVWCTFICVPYFQLKKDDFKQAYCCFLVCFEIIVSIWLAPTSHQEMLWSVRMTGYFSVAIHTYQGRIMSIL